MKVSIDDMADEIMKGLEEYSDMGTDEIKKEVKKAGRNIRKEIMENAPVGKTGKYSKSWSVKTLKETANSIELVVHSRNRYQLAHLLEKGHVLRQGGRVSGRPHIGPAEERGVKELEDNITRKLKNG